MDRNTEQRILEYLETNSLEDLFEALDIDVIEAIVTLFDEGMIDEETLRELVL
jgi:hypothetical protein